MTKNQIEYAKLLESRRASQAQEELTRARDLRANAVALGTLAETERSHKQSEALTRRSLDETVRANLAREAETQRANLERERETVRSNVTRENETERTNRANEQLRTAESVISGSKVAETLRSDVAREAETARANKAREEIEWAKLAAQQLRQPTQDRKQQGPVSVQVTTSPVITVSPQQTSQVNPSIKVEGSSARAASASEASAPVRVNSGSTGYQSQPRSETKTTYINSPWFPKVRFPLWSQTTER